MKEFKMKRAALTVSFNCNLKCKLCVTYSPYYCCPPVFSFEKIKTTIDKFFEVVNYVEQFTLSGGEPLLYNDLHRVIRYLADNKPVGKIEVITNGSIIPSQAMIDCLSILNNRVLFLIDNYGEHLSKHVLKVANILDSLAVSYRIRNYTSDDPHCNGWVDFGSHDNRGYTFEEKKQVFQKCAYPSKLGFCNVIVDGKMYLCSKSRRLIELGIIHGEEYVDFFDDTYSIDEKRKKILLLNKLDYLEACAYCSGFSEDSERFVPAEQMIKGVLYEPR